MALTQNQWQIIKGFYESGLSLNEIIERQEVKGVDRSSISKKAKQEGWVKGKIQHLIDQEVVTKQNLVKIEKEKSTLNSTEVEIVNTLVDERTKHIEFFNNATIDNLRMMGTKINEGTSIAEHRIAQEAYLKGRETVLGKQPETQVNIQNNSPSQQNMVSLQEYAQINAELNDLV